MNKKKLKTPALYFQLTMISNIIASGYDFEVQNKPGF